MAVLPNHNKDVKKKTRPPTFQHLPKNRATKLKKEWVEKKKLKGRWRAQKRKEGLVTPIDELIRSSTSLGAEDHDLAAGGAEEARGSEGDSDNLSEEGSQPSSDNDSGEVPVKRAKLTRPSTGFEGNLKGVERTSRAPTRKVHFAGNETHADSQPNARKGKAVKGSGIQVASLSTVESKPEEPSLRDLERMAYSPSSLHTFKADPLHKRKVVSSGRGRPGNSGSGRGNAHSTRGRGGVGAGREARGAGFGAGRAMGREMTARGQPNMKLRMNAMLERIKRDYT